VTVADITNDFSLCPSADYAISTWGDDFAVATRRPRDETEFARLWWELPSEQLSMFTMLTMAWGLYHGDKGDPW
jgi:DNA-3-methyladenine glycosylase II